MPVSSSLNFFSFVGQYSICFTLQGLDFLSEKSLLWLTLGIQNMLRFFAHTVPLYQNYSCNGREWERMKECKNSSRGESGGLKMAHNTELFPIKLGAT